jgi:hypothetical protein
MCYSKKKEKQGIKGNQNVKWQILALIYQWLY